MPSDAFGAEASSTGAMPTKRAMDETIDPRLIPCEIKYLYSFVLTQLHHLAVRFFRDSDMLIVLSAVAEKVDSLASFPCVGYSVSVATLQLLFASQKNLKRITFHYNGWCTCSSQPRRVDGPPEKHRHDMGLNWKPIVKE